MVHSGETSREASGSTSKPSQNRGSAGMQSRQEVHASETDHLGSSCLSKSCHFCNLVSLAESTA
eukprot:1636869-Amphidinium_carterae.1